MDRFLYVIIVLVLYYTKVNYGEGQQSITGVTRVTREQDGQDVFRNPNRQCISSSCANFKSRTVSAHCASPDCCLCRCNHGSPTYVSYGHACMKRAEIDKLLPVNSIGHQYIVDIRKTIPHCHSNSLSLIDLNVGGSTKLYTCQSQKPTFLTDLASLVNICHVLVNDSWLYTATGWRPFLRTNDDVFSAQVQLDKTANKKYINFKWQNDIDHKYSGLIVFLRITCFNTSDVSRFIKAGFLFKTPGTKTINTQTTTPLYLSTYPATQTTYTLTTEDKVYSSRTMHQKTTHPSTTWRKLHPAVLYTLASTSEMKTTNGTTRVNKGMGRETEKENKKIGRRDVVIIAAASASGLIFGLIVGTLVTVILRKRGDNPNRGNVPRRNSEANPTYDKSIIFHFPEDEKQKDETHTYQPLVQNTRINEQSKAHHLYQGLNEPYGVVRKDSADYRRKVKQGKEESGHPSLAYIGQGGADNMSGSENKSSEDPVYHVLEGTSSVRNSNAFHEEPVYSYILEPAEWSPERNQLDFKQLQGSDTLQDRGIFEIKEIELEEEKNYVEVAI